MTIDEALDKWRDVFVSLRMDDMPCDESYHTAYNLVLEMIGDLERIGR